VQAHQGGLHYPTDVEVLQWPEREVRLRNQKKEIEATGDGDVSLRMRSGGGGGAATENCCMNKLEQTNRGGWGSKE